MVTKAELYLLALQELQKSIGDILTTAIVTPDGLIMSCATSSGVHKETFAAYSAATFKRAGDTMEALSGEDIDLLIFESKNHRVVTIRAAQNALVMALTGKDVQMGLVLMEMQKTGQKVKELLV